MDWFVFSLMAGIYQFYIFVTGRWDWAGYYFRYFLLFLYVVSALFAFLKVVKKPFWQKRQPGEYLGILIQVFVIVLFGLISVMAVKGFFYPGQPLELQFPFMRGTYYIAQGGNSPVLNFHNLGKAQKFAVDISRINKWGFRARGINPDDLEAYFIYGDTVVAPVNGVVFTVVDSVADVKGGEVDTSTVAGNYVGIRSDGYHIFLAHLMQGSVRVRVDDRVVVGQAIARVGCSGYTLEPQLHIHVEKSSKEDILTGKGIPISFRHRFPIRNQLFHLPFP